MTMSELLAGHHYWWYNLTLVIYAFAMFGLILAVAEGIRAAKNVYNYGLHPGGKELPELIVYDPYSDDSESHESVPDDDSGNGSYDENSEV